MRGGGAERVLQNLLNQMIMTYPHSHIHLILAKKEGVLLKGLNSKIKIIVINIIKFLVVNPSLSKISQIF